MHHCRVNGFSRVATEEDRWRSIPYSRTAFTTELPSFRGPERASGVGRMTEKHEAIHILVHSAGIGYEANFVDIGKEEWLRCININLNGVVFMTQPILRTMMEHRYGKIVNVSSQAGKFGRTLHTHYSASKFGLNGFTQALAMEVASYGINVNSVCPSRIGTEMITSLIAERAKRGGTTYEKAEEDYVGGIPIGRMGHPEDVTALVTFLASDEASYITGQFISISGGR
jgi:NAD(P)-dependent dehydrogenase (short-subunit alcohol dehydrogenase family)